MSYYGSQGALNMDRRFGSKPDLTGGGSFHYARSEVVQGGGGGGNGFEPVMDQYNTYNFSRSSLGRVAGGMEGATVSRMASGMVSANAGGMGGGMVSGMGGGMGGEMLSDMGGGMMSGMGGGMMSGMGGEMMSGMGGGMGGEMMSGMRMSKGGGMTISKGGGMVISKGGGMVISKGGGMGGFQQEAMALQSQCQEYLRQAEYALQSGSPGDAQNFMGLAKESIGQLRNLAIDLKQMGQPADNIVRSVDIYNNQLSGVHKVYTSTLQRRKSHKGSSGGYDEPPRSYNDALGWISQQKRLIETAKWGDDPTTIEQQLAAHQRFHASIQRSAEVDRARDDLVRTRDKANLHALDQEWDSLQKLSFSRTQQLQDLLQIIQEISTEIMWVNDKEEQELVFDWGDKNIDQYIPRKQESYSKLMSALEDKEKDLNKLKARVDNLLKNNHPASDKIEAYKDTLQTQWSWILQITKCIDTHLKENAAYSQFFKEAKETQENLQRDHETVKKKFTCDKNSSLEDLLVVLKDLEMEKGRILENKRQVQNLVNRSKDIVRLKPRNPEHKSSSPVIVKALCDFRQEQKVICKGNEAILKNNSQRSKWDVTGPGGLDMSVPSVCLIVPPPNPLSISVANKQEEYYETILAHWNQLYINVKSLIAWQCCLQDIQQINSLNLSLISKMRPDQYQQLIRSLETHYEEFKRTSYGSQMFIDEEKKSIEDQISGAQTHYGQLVLQLPTYIIQQEELTLQQQEARRLEEEAARRRLEEEEEARRRLLEEEARRKLEEEERRKAEERRIKEQTIEKVVVRKTGAAGPKKKVSSSRSLSELHTLRLRLEASEAALSQHVHICLGDDGMHECSSRIIQLETARRDVNDIRELFLRLRERILKELEGMTDTDKAGFLRSEIEVIDQRLADLDGSSAAYLQRLQALKDLLEHVAQVEDIVKVYEARLTEKETTSLSSAEVEDYIGTLTKMKAELDQKQDILASMEAELDKAGQWSGQVGGPFYRCDLMLSKHSEQVGQLSDRWRRIQGQINTRLQDLQFYQPQLVVYKQSSTSLSDWIDVTRKKQDALQAARVDNLDVLKDNMSSQKVLNAEIISKRDELENVLKDNDACFHSVKDYETDLAAYSSGLETLLNIPIKRPMLVSPSMDLSQEAIELQTRYMELLTRSGDHYKFMGELHKKMDELKIRNTRIEVLEEELQNLRGDIQGSQDTNKFQLADLRDQMTNLTYLIEEEKRKTRLAEERYTQQQDEYDATLKKRQSELETVSWSKVEVERSLASKDREIEKLRRQLDEEAERIKELQREISKTTATMKSLQSQYNDIVAERDALLLKLQMSGKDKDQLQRLEEELNRIKLSLETELRNKQRLQDEMERVKRDLSYWKEQYESKQGLIRQSDSDKDRLERERSSLKSEIERLMRELRELEEKYKIKMTTIQRELQEVNVVKVNLESELRKAREPPTFDASTLVFDGVRKPVTADQLLECAVLDKPTFNQLVKGHKTIPEVSADKKINLKGTGPIAGVVIEGPRGSGSSTGLTYKMTLTEAKKENLLPADSADLLLDAQAATGHIIDPRTNQKLTVEEASKRGVIDENDRERLLAAEAAAVGYSTSSSSKPLSAFQAMKKGLIDRNTALRLLQAQESTGGVLDPVLSVFLPKDTAISRDLIDDNIYRALNQRPELYLDPESEDGVTYMSMKRRCKVELNTGLLLLPISDKVDPSKLVFDGVRKPVTATQLLECSVLDKPTFKDLVNLKKTVPEVAVDKNVNLKGTGPIAGVIAGNQGKLSLSEAKKRSLLPEDCADLLLEAQAATGHIIDPTNNQKLTVEEACARGVVESRDRDRLLAAEAAAVGYKNPGSAKPLSVFEAMRKGITDKKTGLRLLQAQESVGGILDPILSVFLPKDTAIKRNLLDENLRHALKQNPSCYTDPETEQDVSYSSLKKRCMTEPHTGLLFLPITEKLDPSKLIFEGVRKPVTAQQLLDCGVLDKLTFNQLVKGEKTVPEVSADKKVFLKGTGSIAGVAAGPLGKMSLAEAKRQMLMPPESADLLLDAQAATGHIIDPTNNRKLTVEEACARGVVDNRDRDRLLEAEAAAVGYRDPSTAKPLSVFGAMKRGLIDKKSALRLLQAQESAGGILDPNLSVFLPKDTAIMRNILDDDISRALNMKPECYIDPDTESDTSYGSLKKRSKTESHTGLILLPITERKDPSKMMFDGVRKLVTAQQLFDCGVLDKPTFNQLVKGEKTVPSVSTEKKVYLKGSGPIAGILVGRQGQLSFSQAKKQLLSEDCADLLLEAQAATGHIIDPETNQKLTVDEACARGVVDIGDRERLLAAEAAAVGYTDPSTGKPLSVFEAMKKGIIDRKTGLRLLQAQESMGGILDPSLSVFLPKDTAIKHNLLDENLRYALRQSPGAYLDPETDSSISYGALKERCLIVPHSGLHFLPVSEKADPSSLLFDGVRKTVTAQQLFDCGILDKQTFDQLLKGEKTVSDVSVDLKVFLKGTGTVAGVAAGPLRKMSFTEAKKQKIMPSDSADLLLEAQAATGYIIDPKTNQKLTVKEACSRGLVDKEDESKLFAAEAGAVGYRVSDHTNVLSVGQAMKRGLISKDAALRMLQAQQSAGGILDPVLSVFLPIGMALDRGILDEDLHYALNQYPACYLDPDDQQATTYVSLKRKCKADPSSGILLLPEPKKPITVRGLRGHVSVLDLVDANLLGRSDMDQLRNGRLTSQDIENRLQPYLRGSTCIAGVYDEASDKVIPIYQAMKDGLLEPKEALELLEAQAASGFIVDPVNGLYLTVSEAYNRRLFGPELKDSLLSAEKAVTGYKLPGTDKVISLFQAIENGMVEKGHGTRLLEAQVASGGIIDPEHGHRVNADVAYKRGYLDLKMNQILTNHSKGFLDPNTEEKVSYQELKKRCITDKHPGLILLPIKKSQESTQKNTVRKTRVLIVDPQTNKEMTIRQAYDKGLIDYQTFLDLSKQEAEWEEITITDPDGSTRFIIVDRKTDREYDITELLEKRVIRQSDLDRYKSRSITLTEFADIITNKTSHIPLSSVTSRASSVSTTSSAVSSSSRTSAAPATLSATSRSSSSSVVARPLSPTLAKMTTTRTTTLTERSTSITSSQDAHDGLRDSSSVSFTLSTPFESVNEQEPIGAVFDTENIEKITITEALNRGLVDSITAQRLLEAQACTGGIVNPTNGQRFGVQEAARLGIITDDMAVKLKPAQKAYIGFEDVKTRKRMSAAEAIKENWLPYEAGNRFLEFQIATGGLCDPEMGCRRTIQDALKLGWFDESRAQKLQDIKHHTKNMTCPKSKLKISYREALDNCMVEERTGVKMLQASSVSSQGISSPYNVSSAPGSSAGSRSGSRRSSRRGSVDLSSPITSTSRYSKVVSFSTSSR